MPTHHQLDNYQRRIEAIEDQLDQDHPGWRDELPVIDLLVNASIQQRVAATEQRLRQLESFVFRSPSN